MKSLNDTLREEFTEILSKEEIVKLIEANDLDMKIINKAFEILLEYKHKPDSTESARTSFENFIVNTLKQTPKNDN